LEALVTIRQVISKTDDQSMKCERRQMDGQLVRKWRKKLTWPLFRWTTNP